MCVRMYVRMYVCKHVCRYVCMYLCIMYVCEVYVKYVYCVKLLGIDNPYRFTVHLDIVCCHTTACP